jgi:luciferase family oxidoreductase group 1
MRLSVLDQTIATAGRPHAHAVSDTLALAEHCERLGYHRFWVSEHHNHATIVGTAPEILLAALAMRTTRIRLGSAGVMLPHYSPFKVAEQFRVLEALAPGRIDLGLGRAPGSDGRTAYALNPLARERPQQFPSDVRDLMAWTGAGEALPDGHPFRTLRAYPAGETSPEVWILGSSDYGAQVAAHFGLPYAFAWFFTDGRGGREALDIYRRTYRPSPRFPEPVATICVWALAADTEEEAQHHFTSRAKWRILRDRGIWEALESPEAAACHPFDAADQARIAALRRTSLVGTGTRVAAGIRTLAADLALDEMVIVTWAYEPEVRRRSYAAIMGAMATS